MASLCFVINRALALRLLLLIAFSSLEMFAYSCYYVVQGLMGTGSLEECGVCICAFCRL